MRQDGHRDVGPPRLRQRTLHQKVDDEDVGRVGLQGVWNVLEVLGARPDVADDGREPLLWRPPGVEIEATAARQRVERQAASVYPSLLRNVAQEPDLVPACDQLLGYPDGRRQVAATIPGDEREARHFAPRATMSPISSRRDASTSARLRPTSRRSTFHW